MTPGDARSLPDAATSDPQGEEEGVVTGSTFAIVTVDDQAYAFPVDAVRAALPVPPVTRLPTMAPHVLGVFHHRGAILALWDLHALFAADGPPPVDPQILVVDHDGQSLGLVVDRVEEVISLERSRIDPVSDAPLPGHLLPAVVGRLEVVVEEDPPSGPEDGDIGAEDGDVGREDGDAGAEDGDVGREDGDAGAEDGDAGHGSSSKVGQPTRAARAHERVGPLILLDVARLYEIGSGRPAARLREETTHGRP